MKIPAIQTPFSSHFDKPYWDALQRQERQIVQSQLNLDDSLPWID